jgi:tetratricopeptide (TPR) repeat protein
MRAAVLVLLVAGTATAGPKQLPAKIEKAAGKAFAAAQEADAKGDLAAASKQYERAITIAPHPDAYFNLADVQVRSKHVKPAIRSYEKYLELAPEAKDRKAVEKRIAELLAMKGALEMEFDEPDGLVFADGKLLGKTPGTYELRAGTYHIDVVSPITHGTGTCEAIALRSSRCHVGGPPRKDGNVVIGMTWSSTGKGWPVDGQRFSTKGRFTVKPGTYELAIYDRQCAPVKLIVPPGDVLTYAFITAPEVIESHSKECIDLKITQRRVGFD